jgi:hypothetical protein
MNIDELKSIWQIHTTETIDNQRVNSSEIRQLAKGKANHALDAFSQNILFDIGFLCLFLMVGFLAMFVYQHHMITTIVLTTSFIFLPLFFIFIKQYNQVRKVQLQTNTLYENLNSIIKNLKKYTKNYFWATMILTVATVPIAALVSLNPTGNYNPFTTMANSDLQLFVFVYSLIIIALVVGNYFFTNWYLKKMYGNYIQELEICLTELDELVTWN